MNSKELIRVARLQPLKQSWTALPNRTLPHVRTFQNLQANAPRPARPVPSSFFFSRRDVHYHFSKPPPNERASKVGPPQQQQGPIIPGQQQQPGSGPTIQVTAPPPPRRWRRRFIFVAGVVASFFAGLMVSVSFEVEEDATLNYDTYVPYEVVHNYPVSSTSFVLVVRPKYEPLSPLPYLTEDGSWWDFQWSVQVKQPELQIQREYTPLPPSPSSLRDHRGGDHHDDYYYDDETVLRFFIRRCDEGEVSSYLSKLREGDTVELRMGSKGYDFSYIHASRPSRFVCLAGGTGIATALQAAHIVFKNAARLHPDTKVQILWATRSIDDIYVNSSVTEVDPEGSGKVLGLAVKDEALWDPNGPEGFAVVTTVTKLMLEHIDDVGSDRLTCTIAVDGRDKPFDAEDLGDILGVTESSPNNKNNNKDPSRPTTTATATTKTVSFPEKLPRAMASSCRPHNNVGVGNVLDDAAEMVLPEKVHNLILVSGPDGFVDKFAGQVERRDGERYRTGGIFGDLNAKYGNPDDPWLVLGFN